MKNILERLIREKNKYYDPLTERFGFIVHKDDLKQRAIDFNKHYDINSNYVYDGYNLLKDGKPILEFKEGLPYAWTKKDNVINIENEN